MDLRKLLIFCWIIFLSNYIYGQTWKPYNDTLVYFYQASNTADYFTLRTKSKTVIGDKTEIHFVDNYIPCDTVSVPDSPQLYYAQNGSVLGDSMIVDNDTVWIDNSIQFVNSMEIGETFLFSTITGTDITYESITDTIIFDTPDSVKYYSISDGTQLIQSKNFGFVLYPKQNSDALVKYQLVGIEGVAGLSFDHHNEIFDFEIGDKFYYHNSYYSVFHDVWGGSDYTQMEVLDKFDIDGHYFYDVMVGGEFVHNYPQTILENSVYDYPGERVQYCRGCEGINSIAFSYLIGDNNEYIGTVGQGNIGHGYSVSPETGNVLQIVGFSDVRDSYTLYGSGGKVDDETSKHYTLHPDDQDELLRITWHYDYQVVYEEGYGITFFDGMIGEFGHGMRLVGAVRSGDTTGVIDASLNNEQMNTFSLFPNPTTNVLNFRIELEDVQIYNGLGELVWSNVEPTNSIMVANLPTGIHLIIGTDANGTRKFSRFIKT